MSRVLDLIPAAHGQCRLNYVSATQIRLDPYNGRNLLINGNLEVIPSAGVTVANTGLTANTTYYVYAYMAAGVMTLELSTTGHSASNGIEIKTGDATRTLVGMIRANASSQFAMSLTSPTVLSWFNRRNVAGATATVTGATASGTFAEITTSARIPMLAWAGEAIEIFVVGDVQSNSSGNNQHTTSPGLDGAAFGAQSVATTYAATVPLPAIARAVSEVSEGFHTASAFGFVSAGTGSWNFGVQTMTRG